MRLTMLAAAIAALSLATLPALPSSALAQTEGCTGENCPPPTDQGGGRDCEKKEQNVS